MFETAEAEHKSNGRTVVQRKICLLKWTLPPQKRKTTGEEIQKLTQRKHLRAVGTLPICGSQIRNLGNRNQ